MPPLGAADRSEPHGLGMPDCADTDTVRDGCCGGFRRSFVHEHDSSYIKNGRIVQTEQTVRNKPASESQSSTRALVARGRAGDRSALDRVFDRATGRLFRWFRGRVSGKTPGAETRDVVQDAALAVFGRLPQLDLRRPGDLDAYMQRVVTNRVTDLARWNIARPPMVSLDVDVHDHQPSPLQLVLDQEAEARYAAAFAALPERDRATLHARAMGYTLEQTAKIAGHASPDAARMAITRAIERLRAAIDPTPHKAG